MSLDPFDVVTVRKAGRSTPSVGRSRTQEEEDDPFASVLVSRPKALTQGQVQDVSPLKIGAPSFQQFAEAGAKLPDAPPQRKYDTAFAEDVAKRRLTPPPPQPPKKYDTRFAEDVAKRSPQPDKPKTSYATSDMIGRLARTTKAEANRPVEEFKQQALDVLKAPLYAARQAVPAVTGMAAPFVEGAYNLLGQPEIAEFTRKTQQDIEQSFAPQSSGEAAIGLPLRLAGLFAPYMAAGATAAPLTVSAGLSGLQSQAKDGSFVEFLGDKLDSDVLKRIAESEYKTPADMVLDVALGLTFGSLNNIVKAAKTTTNARAALRAYGADPFVNAGSVIREGIQSGALDAKAMKPFLEAADKSAQQAKVRASLPLSGAGARAVDVAAGLGAGAAQFGKNVASNVGAEAKLFRDVGSEIIERGRVPSGPVTSTPALAPETVSSVVIPKKPTQGRLDREEFSSRLGRALDAGDDAEVTRLLERQDEVLAGVAPVKAPAPLRPAFSGQTSVLNRPFAPSLVTKAVRKETPSVAGAEWAARQRELDQRGVPEVRSNVVEYGQASQPMPRATAVDKEFQKKVADWYDKAESNPNDPEVQRAYRAFAEETAKQYEYLTNKGMTFDFVDNPSSYQNSGEMMKDIAENKHLFVFKTGDDFDHPLLSAEENDQFRAVHDYFGHAAYGHQFGELGEENAFRVHVATFSPEARRAMATETRGQNSWVNTRPENAAAPGTVYADQKVVLLPRQFMDKYPAEKPLGALANRAVTLANMGGKEVGSAAVGAAIGAAGDEENRLRGAGVGALVGLGAARGGAIGLSTRNVNNEEVNALVGALRNGAKQAEEFGLTSNVELASMKDRRFAGVEDLGEDALELQLGAVNGTVEPLAKAAGLRMGRDIVAKPSFGLWFGESANADVQPSVLLQFGKDVDRKKALAVVAEYSRIAKQKAMFFMEPDDNGTRLALSFVVRDADGTPIPSNLVLDLVREGRAGWNGAMLTDDASRTILALDEGIGLPQAQTEIDRINAVLQSAGFLTEVTGAARVNAAEIGERGYAALANSAGMERGTWARAVSDAERLYEGVAVTAEKQIAARRIFNRPDAQTLALNLDPAELAAVRTAGRGGKPGRIYTGPNHRGASYYAQKAGYKGALEDGYTLTNGEFVSRSEAEAVMELMAERGDELAERSVNAVQARESSGRISVLRSEDIYKADKNNELARRVDEASQPITSALAGKTFDVGGALGEGVSALSNAPGGKAQIAKVGLGAVGYGLSQSEDERLQAHGNALMGLAAYSLVHGKVKQGAKAAGAAVAEELAKSPMGRKVLDEISLDIRVDPRVKETVDVAMREMAKYRAIGRKLASEAKARGGVFDRTVSDLVEKEAVEADALSPEDMEIAVALAQKVADNSLGLKKVEARLMSADTYAKRGTAYLPRRYAKYEAKDVNDVVVQHKGKTFRISGEKIRNDALTREERDALGEIREASYRIADYFGRGSKDIATAHLFEALSEIPGVIHPEYVSAVREAAIAADLSRVARTPTAAYRGSPTAARDALRAADVAKARAKGLSEQFKRQGQEYVTLPDTPQLGVLRGAVVRKDAAAYLNDLPDFQSTNRMYNRLMHYWKSAHTVFNVPATHLTNMASNVFMGILGGLPIQEQVIAIPRALKDIQEYGPTTRFLTEAGVIDRALPTYGDTPIKGLARDETVLRSMMKTTRPETREALEAQGLKSMSWMEEKARKVGGKIETAYSLGDTMFRVALFDKLSKQGMTNEDALKEVMRVFPGYDTRSPILQKLKHVSPFVMYPAKYLPAALNLIAEHPWRWALASASWAAIDQASRRQAGAVREEDLPPNRRFGKGGYLVPGPIQAEALGLKSKEAGKRLMFDMARYTPFTALTGSPAPGTTVSAISEKLPGIVQPSGPLADIIARGVLNVDPFSGKPFIKKSDDAMDKLKKFTVGTTEAGRFSPGLAASLLLPSSLAYHLPNVAKDLYYGNAEAAKMSAAGLVGGRPIAVKRGQQAGIEDWKLQQQIREVNAELEGDLRAARDMVVRRNLIKKAMEKRQRLVKESRKSRQP